MSGDDGEVVVDESGAMAIRRSCDVGRSGRGWTGWGGAVLACFRSNTRLNRRRTLSITTLLHLSYLLSSDCTSMANSVSHLQSVREWLAPRFGNAITVIEGAANERIRELAIGAASSEQNT